jgi:hypothetical protein
MISTGPLVAAAVSLDDPTQNHIGNQQSDQDGEEQDHSG